MYIASVLHVFNISAGVDESGKPVELTPEVEGGIVAYVSSSQLMSRILHEAFYSRQPKNVPRGFTPRSDEALRLILECVDATA